MAHRIAEHKDVLLPLMVCQDGFITSHSIENIELEEDEKVKKSDYVIYNNSTKGELKEKVLKVFEQIR